MKIKIQIPQIKKKRQISRTTLAGQVERKKIQNKKRKPFILMNLKIKDSSALEISGAPRRILSIIVS